MATVTGKIFGGLVFAVVAVIAVASGASNILTKSAPELAVNVNPLNISARINVLSRQLAEKEISADKLEEFAERANSIIKLSPRDGRGYSLLGEIRFRQGRKEQANDLFVKTLQIAPTEVNALRHRINTTLSKGEFDQALSYMDLLLRRWPKSMESLRQVAVGLAQNQPASQLFADLLLTNPPWRNNMIKHLASNPGALDFLQKLMLREKTESQKVDKYIVTLVIHNLVKAKRYLTAYRTFVLSLRPEERKALGYVFNSDFQLPSDYRTFNWRVIPNAEADVDFQKPLSTNSPGGLAVTFRQGPAKLKNIQQYVILPPGNYTLNTRATARGLTIPKKLFWEILCIRGRVKAVSRLDIVEGTYANQAFTKRFSIPANACPLQLLRLRTDLISASWSARYHGLAVFHNIIISRDDSRQSSSGSGQ